MILRSKKRSNDTPPPSPEQRSPLVNVGSIPSADREPRASRSVTTNPTGNARSASATAGSIDVATKFLELRRSYHKLTHQFIQAAHHRHFLENCLDEGLIPEGLRLKLEPQAFMSSMTGLKDKWEQTTAAMSKSLIKLLIEHYSTVANTLDRDLDPIKDDLEEPPFSPTPQETEDHDRIMEKTEKNLHNFKTSLEKKATKKLQKLRNPPTPSSPTPKTKPKPSQRKGKNRNRRDNKTSPLPAHPNPNSTSKPKPNPSPNPIPNPTPNHHPRSYADAARDFQRPGPGNPTSRRNGNQTHPRQQQMAVTPNHPPLLPLPAPLPNRPPPLLPRPAPLLNQPPPPLPLPLPPPIPPLFPSPNLTPPTTPPPPTNLIPLLLSLTQALQHLVTGGSAHPTGGPLTAPISKP